MKNILKQLFFLSLLVALFPSCKKDEHKVYFEGGTPPVLTASVTSPDLPLSFVNRDNEALQLTWTNPNYQFNTGISSQDVSYQIEIDTAGANFTNPKRQTISVAKELSHTFLVSEFNGYLLNQLQLDTSVVHNIEIRVTSSLVNSSAVLHSNVLKYTVVPYAIPPVVAPPASGELYIVGSAVSGGWNNPVTDPVGQKFTQISPTDYQLTIALIGDGEYKFISVNGLWDSDKQWSIKNEPASGDPSTLNYDLYPNGGNCRAPSISGTYKIDVDFQRGKVTLTKQ